MDISKQTPPDAREIERSGEEAVQITRDAIAKLRSRTTSMPVTVRTHQFGRAIPADHPAINDE